jgi:hypothetical protein
LGCDRSSLLPLPRHLPQGALVARICTRSSSPTSSNPGHLLFYVTGDPTLLPFLFNEPRVSSTPLFLPPACLYPLHHRREKRSEEKQKTKTIKVDLFMSVHGGYFQRSSPAPPSTRARDLGVSRFTAVPSFSSALFHPKRSRDAHATLNQSLHQRRFFSSRSSFL